jgi:hypothetical protein
VAAYQGEVAAGASRPAAHICSADLDRVAAVVTQMAEQVLGADGELFAELAPRFVKQFTVDKERRVANVEFYDVPGFRQMPNPGTRIEMVARPGRGAGLFG